MAERPRVALSPPPVRMLAGARFRVFWSGQAVSLIGSQITVFTLPVLAVLTLNASPVQMSLVVAATTVPNMLAPLYAGPVVDAAAKRPLMRACDVIRAVALCALPALYLAHRLDLVTLLAIAFVTTALNAVFDSALFSLVPLAVPSDTLTRVNGRLESARSLAQVAGPGAAGSLIALVGAPFTMLADAFSFTVSAFTLRWARVVADRPGGRPHGARQYLRSVGEGFRGLRELPTIRMVALASAGFNVFIGAAEPIIVIFVLHTLHFSARVYGAAFAVGCVGGVVGGLVADRLRRRIGMRASFVLGLMIGSAAELALAFGQPHRLWSLALISGGMFVNSFGVTLFIVNNATLRQRWIPEAVRGRVFATLRTLNGAALPFGALLGGPFATLTSPRVTLFAAGVGELSVSLYLLTRRRRLPVQAEEGREPAAAGEPELVFAPGKAQLAKERR